MHIKIMKYDITLLLGDMKLINQIALINST